MSSAISCKTFQTRCELCHPSQLGLFPSFSYLFLKINYVNIVVSPPNTAGVINSSIYLRLYFLVLEKSEPYFGQWFLPVQ